MVRCLPLPVISVFVVLTHNSASLIMVSASVLPIARDISKAESTMKVYPLAVRISVCIRYVVMYISSITQYPYVRIYPWLASLRLPLSKFGVVGFNPAESPYSGVSSIKKVPSRSWPRTCLSSSNYPILSITEKVFARCYTTESFPICRIDCMDQISRNVRQVVS